MITFIHAWALSFVALIVFAGWIGWRSRKTVLGILIDGRGRYSLTHFQLVLWTVTILSSVIGVLVSQSFDPSKLLLTPQLLGLMGISVGSAVLATGVKDAKDAGTSARVAKAGAFVTSNGTTVQIKAQLAQIWLEEEGELADKVVSVSKFQNFIFTLTIVGVYIALALKEGALPVLPENIWMLIGISQAGYVGGKIPDKK